MNITKITLTAFRAINNPTACERFLEGHLNVLRVFNLTKITSANKEWMTNPGVYVVMAEDENGKVVGGIRLHKVDASAQLPVEEALSTMDSSVTDLVNFHATQGAGEFCALWNDRSFKGKGLSAILTQAGLSIANQINCPTVFGCCADFTLPLFKKSGYQVESTLGKDGAYSYPTPEYNCYVIRIPNVNVLATADEEVRNNVFEMRNNPFLTKTVGNMEVSCNLMIGTAAPEVEAAPVQTSTHAAPAREVAMPGAAAGTSIAMAVGSRAS